MAAASFTEFDTSKTTMAGLSPEDQNIMQKSYAQAVSFLGYKPDLIIYAVKMLTRQQKVLEVGRLMLEVEKLDEQVKRDGSLPPLDALKGENRYSSDGESESDDSMDYVDAQGPPSSAGNMNDLQTDGEEVVTESRRRIDQLPEPEVKAKTRSEKDSMALRLKLKALRVENQKLKERQLCKNCRQRNVSITFLPCGHYSYCYECGQKFAACPVCRKTILADVRTFMA